MYWKRRPSPNNEFIYSPTLFAYLSTNFFIPWSPKFSGVVLKYLAGNFLSFFFYYLMYYYQ